MRQLYINVFDNPAARTLDLYISEDVGSIEDGQAPGRYVAEEIKFRLLDEKDDGRQLEPTLRLSRAQDRHALQVLANKLWECGIRPEQAEAGETAHAAQGRHLEDFRAIVSKQLKVTLP